MFDDWDWLTGGIIAALMLVALVLGFAFYQHDQDTHKGCRKIEGYIGGHYSYIWDCPPSGGK